SEALSTLFFTLFHKRSFSEHLEIISLLPLLSSDSPMRGNIHFQPLILLTDYHIPTFNTNHPDLLSPSHVTLSVLGLPVVCFSILPFTL
ncbi:mCG145592, partial [Mus musculus]